MSSCSSDDLDTYSGIDAGIFIQEVSRTDINGNPHEYRDEIERSFSNYSEDITYVYERINIRTIGKTKNYDRPFVVEVIPEETNAVEGEDFDLSENESVIKAGESTARYNVKLLRTPRLRHEKLQITLRIVPNEHFSVPITELKNSASWSDDGEMLPTDRYKIIFSEEYVLPWPWGDVYFPQFFGTYTVSKLMVINNVMGWTFSSWSDGTVAYGKLDFVADQTRRYLQKMADAGTPVLDEDGSYMQLASKYLVNYQAYLPDVEE